MDIIHVPNNMELLVELADFVCNQTWHKSLVSFTLRGVEFPRSCIIFATYIFTEFISNNVDL